MKFSTREDVEAPIDGVFEMLTSFENYERAAMRRGADVRRTPGAPMEGLGAAWKVRFMLKGKERDLALEVVRCERPTDLVVNLSSRNIVGAVSCELFALSRNRTRMTFAVEVRPLTLPARLLIQSLKLTKSKLSGKYKERVSDLAREIETRYHRQV